MKFHHQILLLIIPVLFLLGCTKNPAAVDAEQPDNDLSSGWLVPLDRLTLSNYPPDRIQSLDNPVFENIHDKNLFPDETVFIYRQGDTVKIYPADIVADHEIINDRIGGHYFTVSLCPLTGSAICWNRRIQGKITEFGVSGHLYNDNLIPYDRNDTSFWSQMLMKSIKGIHGGKQLDYTLLVKTSGSTARAAFPQALVLVDENKLKSRSSPKSNLPGDYFGVVNVLEGQPANREVALLFSFNNFNEDIGIYRYGFAGNDLIVAGSVQLQFIVAFMYRAGDPGKNYFPVQNALPVIMEDEKGNRYDMTGLAVSGPDKGYRLKPTPGYFARGWAFELFFNEIIIFIGK